MHDAGAGCGQADPQVVQMAATSTASPPPAWPLASSRLTYVLAPEATAATVRIVTKRMIQEEKP